MALVTLVYFSTHLRDDGRGSFYSDLNDILVTANRNNEMKNITGALVYDEKYYVQVLEGDLDVVWPTFKKIEKDERHSNISFVEMEAVPERYFAHWGMGVAARDQRTGSIFAPYLRNGQFDPSAMTGIELVSMLIDLRKSLD